VGQPSIERLLSERSPLALSDGARRWCFETAPLGCRQQNSPAFAETAVRVMPHFMVQTEPMFSRPRAGPLAIALRFSARGRASSSRSPQLWNDGERAVS
jgi:hypothetical protein